MTDDATIGQRVAKWAEVRHLSVAALAERMEVNRSTVHRLMAGEMRWRTEYVAKAATALGIAPSVLFDERPPDVGVAQSGRVSESPPSPPSPAPSAAATRRQQLRALRAHVPENAGMSERGVGALWALRRMQRMVMDLTEEIMIQEGADPDDLYGDGFPLEAGPVAPAGGGGYTAADAISAAQAAEESAARAQGVGTGHVLGPAGTVPPSDPRTPQPPETDAPGERPTRRRRAGGAPG